MERQERLASGWMLPAIGAFLFGLAYLPALDNLFVSDDWSFLVEAQKLLETGDLARVFSFRSDWFYRPLQFLLTAFLYQLTGLEVWSYRLVVILVHAANVLLLGRLAYRLALRTSVALPARELAGLTAAFFAFSPRNHEAVFWYAAATEPVAMLLRLVGLLLLLEALERFDRRGWLAGLGVVAAFGAALATKEPAIAFGAEAGLVFLFTLATASERRREIVARGALIGVSLITVALVWLKGYLDAGSSLRRADLVPLEAPVGDWALRLLQGFFRQFFFCPLITKEALLWKLGGLILIFLAVAVVRRKWLAPFAFLWNLALLAPYGGTTAAVDQLYHVPILARAAGYEDRYLYYPIAGLALFLMALADLLIGLPRERPALFLAARRTLAILLLAWALVGVYFLWGSESAWDRAGRLARDQAAPLGPLAPVDGGALCLTRLPANFDHYRGHYVLRNALPSMLYVQLGRSDFNVRLPPIRPEEAEQCDVLVDLNAAWAGKADAVSYPLPNQILQELAACIAERKPATQTGEVHEPLIYVHLFKGDSIGRVGPYLWPVATFQELQRPDDRLLFFRLWVGEHRSAVLTSELLMGTLRENLGDPSFRAELLEMADELGARREVEALLATPPPPPALRIYQNRLILLPGPYAVCGPKGSQAASSSGGPERP